MRQSMGLPGSSGATTAGDLWSWLNKVRLDAESIDGDDRIKLSKRIAAGWWAIVLGDWVAPNVAHWVVLYDYGALRAWFMDPWSGTDRSYLWPGFMNRYLGSAVYVKDPNPRRT